MKGLWSDRERQIEAARRLGHLNLGRIRSSPAELHPTAQDIAWAAGVFEGEGCSWSKPNSTTYLNVGQKQEWLPERLRMLFGGRVCEKKITGLGRGRFYVWQATGTRARGFLMTIYPFLSPLRRIQVKKALCLPG